MSPSTVFMACVMSGIALMCLLGAVIVFFDPFPNTIGGLVLGSLAIAFACMAVNEVRRDLRGRKPARGFEVVTGENTDESKRP